MTQEKKALIKKLLHSFWLEMNVWEKQTYNDYTNGEDNFDKKVSRALESLIVIYEKYLTKKTRKTGRLAGPDAGLFPEYDINLEEIISIEENSSKKIIVTTKKRDHNISDYYTNHRYTIVEKKVFLIDTKETYRPHEEKWLNDVF